MRLLKPGFIFFSIAVVLASCAPAPIIRSVRAGDENQIQGDISQGDNINGMYHSQDLRWCWIPVIGIIGYPGLIWCPIQQGTDKSTPLITAIGSGNFKAARLLVEHGADVNLPARYFYLRLISGFPATCPLVEAIESVNTKQGAHLLFNEESADEKSTSRFAKFLIKHGADVNRCSTAIGFSNLPPMIAAADVGNTEIAKMLLDHGADIEATDAIWGGTPLMWAAWRGHAKMVEWLLKKGANVHAIAERSADRTALDWADCPSSPHNPEVIRLITAALRNNAPVQVASSESRQESSSSFSAAIFKASRDGDDDQVRSLIRQGVDVNASDSYGFTPLMWAAYEGQTDTAEILLKAGAHVTMTNRDGDNALMIASDKGHLDMVKLLFRHGAPLNARDEKGFTALMWAEKRHHHNVVKFLKENGARAAQARNQLKAKPEAQKADIETQSSRSEEPADVNSVLP